MSCLPDTAEYWDDVKRHNANKRVFVHIPNVDCGHYHVVECWTIAGIDCYACKKILEDDPALRAALEKKDAEITKKKEAKRRKRQEEAMALRWAKRGATFNRNPQSYAHINITTSGVFTMTTIGEFKGYPTIALHKDSDCCVECKNGKGHAFSFGNDELCLLDTNIKDIEAFVASNGGKDGE